MITCTKQQNPRLSCIFNGSISFNEPCSYSTYPYIIPMQQHKICRLLNTSSITSSFLRHQSPVEDI